MHGTVQAAHSFPKRSDQLDQTVVDLGKQADVVKVSCNIVQGACEIAHGTVYDCM